MSGIDRHLRPLLFRQRGLGNNPKAIEEILTLSEQTKKMLYHILQEAENAGRQNRNRMRW